MQNCFGVEGTTGLRQSREMILLLIALQALLLINNITTMLFGGPIGALLSDDLSLATLPITTYVVGTALTALPASLLMRRIGRRTGFMLGSAIGCVGAVVCGLGLSRGSFALFSFGTFLSGSYSAFGQYYRLAAAELVPDSFRSRAISYVLGGGMLGAFVGPWSATATKDLFATAYLGPYFIAFACAVLSFGLVRALRMPAAPGPAQSAAEPARPLAEIVAQPRFIAAVLGAVTGYAVMNFLMTATPLAMHEHHHGDTDTAFVFQWHVIAMFAPSFFTGALIQRFGVTGIMATGAGLMVASAAVAHAGTSVPLFWTSLVLLGLGWNFLYVGGTTMLVTTHRPSERGKVQGVNDMLVFAGTGTSSLLSGVLLNYAGWQGMALATLPLIAVTLAALFWARGRPLPQALPAKA
jgi:MFS family permease